MGPDNNFQCHVPHSSIRGAWKRLISFRLAPECCPHLESSPAPATNLGYPPLIPSTLPTFHTPLPGALKANGFLHLPHTHQPALGRTTPHWAPTPVGATGQIQPLHPPMMEGYVLGSGQGWSPVRPCGAFCSTPGPPPPLVPALGRGIWTVPSEGLAQPLYLFFQSDGGCQGPPVGFSHFGKLGFDWSASPLSPWGSVCIRWVAWATSGGSSSFCHRQFFKEDTMSLINFPVHMVGMQAISSVCRLGNRDPCSLLYWYRAQLIRWQRHLPVGPNTGGYAGSLGRSFVLPPLSPNEQLKGTFPVESGGSVASLSPNVGIHPGTYQCPYDSPSLRSTNPLHFPTPWQWGFYLSYPYNATLADCDN